MRKKKGVYITMRRVNRVVSAAVALCMAATMVAPVWAAAPTADAPYGYHDQKIDFTATKGQNVWADQHWDQQAIDKAFDGNVGTYYESNNGNVDGREGQSVKLAWTYEQPVAIDGIHYIPRSSSNQKGAWMNFAVYGKAEAINGLPTELDSSWEVLYQGNDIQWNNKASLDIPVNSSKKVQSVCVVVTKVKASGNATVSAAEIEAYQKVENSPVTELEISKEIMKDSAVDNSHQYDAIRDDGNIKSAFDDNIDGTFWHVRWDKKLENETDASAANPYEIKWNLVEDLSTEKTFPNKLRYRGRNFNGDWERVRVSVTDSNEGKEATNWKVVYEGAVQKNLGNDKDADIVFQKVLPATAMKVEILQGRGGFASATDIKVYKKMATPVGASLTLDGTIGVNFYYNLSDNVLADSNAKVVITVPQDDATTGTKEITFDNAAIKAAKQKNGTYKFTAPVTARQMQDNINVKVMSGDTVLDHVDNYTVRQNAEALLHDESKVELSKLSRNMLNYGSKMQTYKNYKTDNLADKDLNGDPMRLVRQEASAVTAENFAKYKATFDGTLPEGLTDAGLSLMLKSNTSVRIYFNGTPAEGTTFTLDGDVVKPTVLDGHCYVETAGIDAKSLGKKHTLIVANGDQSKTYNFSALSYGQIVRNNNESGNLKELVCAMYKYNEAAVAYAAANK